MSWLTDRYRHAATWAIEHRYVTVGVAVCALLLAGFLGFSGSHRLGVPAPPG